MTAGRMSGRDDPQERRRTDAQRHDGGQPTTEPDKQTNGGK